MGEIIGEIGQSVGKIAVLMVPDQWDPKTGKPTHYLQLSEDHFLNMGINVGWLAYAGFLLAVFSSAVYMTMAHS